MCLADFSSDSFTLFVSIRRRIFGSRSWASDSFCLAYHDTRRYFRVSLRIDVLYSEARTLKAATDYSSLAKLAYCRAWKFDCASSSFNDQLSSRERVLPPTKTFLVVGRASEDVWAHLPLGEVDSINISLTATFYNCVVDEMLRLSNRQNYFVKGVLALHLLKVIEI